MTKKKVIAEGVTRHTGECDCVACQKLRDGNSCAECGGDVVVEETERQYQLVCRYCNARASFLKPEVESDGFEPTQDSLVRIAQLRRKGLSYAEAIVWHAVEERGLSKRALSDESESAFSMGVSRGSIQTPHTRAEEKLADE